ncbi:MAG: RluA family pseudouridine synthase [Cyanobacteria bacterium P01_E01_bin.6]
MEPKILTLQATEVMLDHEANCRLDRWLACQLPYLSRSRIQSLIEGGHVCINDESCTTKKQLVVVGDRLTVSIPDPQPMTLIPEAIPLEILYEDASIIIVNKVAGMVVHPAPGHNSGTLVHALLAHCPDLAGIGGVERPGIVHRLDKDTTGAIVVAKTELAMQHLQAQIRTKEARRSYLAVVHGSPSADEGTVDRPIGRHPTARKKMGIVPVEKWGRTAITHWQVKERMGSHTLMHFQLETGRTHQIRVHCADIGHPIVGDPLYSSGRSIGVNLPGQALHAWKLRVHHPVTDEWIEAIAPLPEHFERLLTVLQRRN